MISHHFTKKKKSVHLAVQIQQTPQWHINKIISLNSSLSSILKLGVSDDVNLIGTIWEWLGQFDSGDGPVRFWVIMTYPWCTWHR